MARANLTQSQTKSSSFTRALQAGWEMGWIWYIADGNIVAKTCVDGAMWSHPYDPSSFEHLAVHSEPIHWSGNGMTLEGRNKGSSLFGIGWWLRNIQVETSGRQLKSCLAVSRRMLFWSDVWAVMVVAETAGMGGSTQEVGRKKSQDGRWVSLLPDCDI